MFFEEKTEVKLQKKLKVFLWTSGSSNKFLTFPILLCPDTQKDEQEEPIIMLLFCAKPKSALSGLVIIVHSSL